MSATKEQRERVRLLSTVLNDHDAATLCAVLEDSEELERLRGCFERAYAKRSLVSVEWLHQHGRYAAACFCDEDDCEGWQMARLSKDGAKDE